MKLTTKNLEPNGDVNCWVTMRSKQNPHDMFMIEFKKTRSESDGKGHETTTGLESFTVPVKTE
jgi:hypothetical protein